MSSLAERPELVGFFSYSREDDEDSRGSLSELRDRIQRELRSQLGRSSRDFHLWQDKEAIAPGKLWEAEIKAAIEQSVFFIPIVTPTAVRSSFCRIEFESFLERERALGRNDLIFPILYIKVPALEDRARREAEPVLSMIAARQWVDWQEFRLHEVDTRPVREAIAGLCSKIVEALTRPDPSQALRERRRQEEVEQLRQRAELERGRRNEEQARRRPEQAPQLKQGEKPTQKRSKQERSAWRHTFARWKIMVSSAIMVAMLLGLAVTLSGVLKTPVQPEQTPSTSSTPPLQSPPPPIKSDLSGQATRAEQPVQPEQTPSTSSPPPLQSPPPPTNPFSPGQATPAEQGGVVVMVVNLPPIKPGQMTLDGPAIGKIFLGNIARWNDPAIAKLNPGLDLPSTPIAVVHRSDSSGATFIFTNYLSKVSPEWKSQMGEGTSVQWPVGLGGKGNEGVSAIATRTLGGIGYVEYAYALQNKIAYVLHVPDTTGGIVMVVNLPGVPLDQFKLNGNVLADMYLGNITKWNEPAIAKLNPGLNLPSTPIAVVHRSDSSGATLIFTNYLSKVSPEWKSRIGAGTSVYWPVALGGKGNEGVSFMAAHTIGSIGYVEYAYALQNKIAYVLHLPGTTEVNK
jgi:ABC-type phosphate transport system substrate-binding protein